MNKVALLTIMFFSLHNVSALAETKQELCEKTLNACDTLVTAQSDEITLLKTQVSTLEDHMKDEQSGLNVPDWVWFVVGVGAGAAITYSLSR